MRDEALNSGMDMDAVKNVLVLGLGISGRSAALLLAGRGCRVTVLDSGRSKRLAERAAELAASGIEVVLQAEKLPDTSVDLAVASPGIPRCHPLMTALHERNIPVRSELELGWHFCRGRTIAVTGSTGKSTLVKLIAETLAHAGQSVQLGGNYGIPVCEMARARSQPAWNVLEVSSFQLETVQDFRPDIGVLLNIQPNHLDRHRDMASYRRAKMKMFSQMGAEDRAVLPAAFEYSSHDLQAPVWTFGYEERADFKCVRAGVVRHGASTVKVAQTVFDNAVMMPAMAAAAAVLEAAGVGLESLNEYAPNFETLPHRMQHIDTIHGVVFINDSKSTTLSSLRAAVQMSPGPVHLIAGGRCKEHDLSRPVDVFKGRVKSVFLIGECAPELERAWSRHTTVVGCQNLQEAVAEAHRAAAAGDCVLLSPGCASFDMFESYQARGEQFVQVVKRLATAQKS